MEKLKNEISLILQYVRLKECLKMSSIVLLFFLFLVPRTAWAQTTTKVSLNLEKVSVNTFLKEIEKQTKLGFIYDAQNVDKKAKVSIQAANEEVQSVLKRALSPLGLAFELDKNVIVVKKQSPRTNSKKDEEPTEKLIEGVVYGEDGATIPGVAIIDLRSQLGVTTDLDGKFSFVIPIKPSEKVILLFSYLGKKDEKVAVGIDALKNLKVVMQEQDNLLDEVVVTGIGNRAKNSFSGAVTKVKREQLLEVGSKDLLSSISALVPGMLTLENNTTGSDPNSLPDFLIRGRNSFSGASRIPTFVVDGAEVDMEYVYNLNLDEVESVTVLKDASATALYGSKAANGVIVIRTNPIVSGNLNVSYAVSLRLGVPDLTDYDLLNAADKLEYERLAGAYVADAGNSSAQYERDKDYAERLKRVKEGVNTNWISKPVRNTLSHNHNLQLSGGNENVRYAMGFRYSDRNGVMKGSGRDNYGLVFTLSYNTERLFLSNTIDVGQRNGTASPYGSFSDFVKLNPYDRAYNLDGTLNTDLSYEQANPLYEASLGSYSQNESFYLTNRFKVKYNILEELRLEGELSLTKNKDDDEVFKSPKSAIFDGVAGKEKGSMAISNTKKLDYQGKLFVTYNKKIQENTLLSVLAGGNIQQNESNASSFKAIGILSDKLDHVAFAQSYEAGRPSGSQDLSREIGFFTSANAIYKDRYFMDFSYRYEGSSAYGANSRFAPFWSVGGGWNVHKENFMEGSKINQLRLRGSVGYVGNSNFDPTQALTLYNYTSSLFYGNNIGATLLSIGNPDLQWQRSIKTNLGIDFTGFNNRVDASFNYYNETTDNLLLQVDKAPSVGIGFVNENIGKLSNKGWEVRVRVLPISTKDINWALSLTASHNANKIKEISNALKYENERNNLRDSIAAIPVYEEGQSINALKVVRSAGIDPATGREIYIKRDGSLTFHYDYNDKVIVGDQDPKVYGSFGSYFNYKGFFFNAMISYRLGAMLYNQTLVSRVEGSDYRYNADQRVFDSRWKHPGDIARFKDIALKGVPKQTTRFVEEEYRFDISSLSLGYQFPQIFCKKLGLKQLRVEVRSSNLAVFSTVKQERGLAYPFERSVELSIRTNF